MGNKHTRWLFTGLVVYNYVTQLGLERGGDVVGVSITLRYKTKGIKINLSRVNGAV